MTTLTIDRLSATVHVSPGDVHSAPRVERLMRAMADDRLDAEMARQPWPDGIVCIDRVDVSLAVGDLDDDRLVAVWSHALASALADAARAGTVVRYPHELAALSDLVTELAARRVTRAWAWRQAGVLGAADPSVCSEPVAALLAALSRRPAYAPAALAAAVRAVGVPALDRTLGRDGWERVRRVLVTTGPASRTAGCTPAATVSRRDVAPLADRVLAASAVAARVRASGLRLSDQAAETLALLALAETEPAQLTRGEPTAVIALVAARLRATPADESASDRPLTAPAPSAVIRRGPDGAELTPADESASDRQFTAPAPSAVIQRRPDSAAPAIGGAAVATSSPDLAARAWPGPAAEDPVVEATAQGGEDVPDLPDRPDLPGRLETSWAGLPFLLALADDLGLPDRILDDPVLGRRPLPWVLRETGTRLADADRQDPGVRSFSGRMDPDPSSTALADTHESAALDDLADAWSQACLDRLLDAGSDQSDPGLDLHNPARAVLRVASRHGVIEASPGWIDVVLDADAADTLVRRAGLDLDPGWIPWLGTVLRYRYV